MLVEQSVVCPVLIGRAAPLSTVGHTLQRARASHGGTLLVSGEAGIGKSRLVRAMIEEARSSGFVAMQGACFEADRVHPYAPVVDLVSALASTTSASLAAHAFAPAATELVTLFPELRSVFADTAPRKALDPEEERRRFFHSFSEAVYALARVQPLLLVIEDVHWSDDATLDLLLHLARRIAAQPIALVLTYRSDEVGARLARLLADFDRARCASEVGLRPLGVDAIAAMLHAIFGSDAAFEASFVDGLYAMTEGNPFFVEEMLKALLVDGDLTRSDGVWRTRPLEHVRLPRTAIEAVGRRLAGLSDAARGVASVAAVAGRRFDFGLLRSLTTHSEAELLALVRELVDAQLVVEESADRFAFRHALTRESIRMRLLARERVALHRAIADALEREAQAGSPDVDDALAYHAFEAGEWSRARQYALRAAEHALTLFALREALQQFDRAVTATGNDGNVPGPTLLLARGRVSETLGAFPQANDDFIAALRAAREAGDPRTEWEALHSLGMLWSARDYERAGEFRREALGIARSIGEPALVAHSLNRVGNWHVNREDPYSGIPHHEEALAIFERDGDRHGVAQTVDLIGMAHHIAGAQSKAVALLRRSVRLFAELEDRRGTASALAVLVVCGPSFHVSAVPVESAEPPEWPVTERSIQIAVEIGWRAGEAFTRFIYADRLVWRGEYERALKLLREALAIALEIEHLEWQCGIRRLLGVVALDLFATTEAVAQLDAAHDIARRLGSATWIRWTGGPLAIALTQAGDDVRANEVLGRVDELVNARVLNAAASSGVNQTLGERHLALARAELALFRRDPAAALAELGGSPPAHTPRAALIGARALAMQERWTDAHAWLDRAAADAADQHAQPTLWRIEAARGAVLLRERRRRDARQAFDRARSIAAALVAGLGEPALLSHFHSGVDLLAPPAPRPTSAQTARAEFGGLTRRERQMAALVAQGKSNRAIARVLGIGERTVEGYVAGALAKLAFNSRAQLAAWAAEQGIAAAKPDAGPPPR